MSRRLCPVRVFGVSHVHRVGSSNKYHFLKGETLRLGHVEPDKCRTDVRQDTEENIGVEGDVFEQIGGDLSNTVKG